MEPDSFLSTLITIRRSEVGSPGQTLTIWIPGVSAPFKRKPFALAHLNIDSLLNDLTSLLHGRRELFCFLSLFTVIPCGEKCERKKRRRSRNGFTMHVLSPARRPLPSLGQGVECTARIDAGFQPADQLA